MNTMKNNRVTSGTGNKDKGKGDGLKESTCLLNTCIRLCKVISLLLRKLNN